MLANCAYERRVVLYLYIELTPAHRRVEVARARFGSPQYASWWSRIYVRRDIQMVIHDSIGVLILGEENIRGRAAGRHRT